MTKYHIDDNGNPVACPAKIKCRKGGDDVHIETDDINEARAFAEQKLNEQYATFGSANNSVGQENMTSEDKEEEIEGIYEDYDIDEYGIEHHSDLLSSIHYNVGGVSFTTSYDSDTNVREEMLSDLENWDLNSHLEEVDVDAQAIHDADRSAQELNATANDIRTDLGKETVEYDSINSRVDREIESLHSTASQSARVDNAEEANTDNIGQLIEDYGLDHNNSEVFEQDDETFIVVEAPNHGTFLINHDNELDGDRIEDVRHSMRSMAEFDADDEFDTLWSKEFGEHNGFTADQFYVMLKSDEAYFKRRSLDIEEDVNNSMPL